MFLPLLYDSNPSYSTVFSQHSVHALDWWMPHPGGVTVSQEVDTQLQAGTVSALVSRERTCSLLTLCQSDSSPLAVCLHEAVIKEGRVEL